MTLIERLRPRDTHAPRWARHLFASELKPTLLDGEAVLVWTVDDDTTATISEQFTTNAETYHQRYAASDHFEALFAQAIAATHLRVSPRPRILDLGSGSGVNSVVPCQRLFPGARIVATDLSAELLAMLAGYVATTDEAVVCVAMDAMSHHAAPGRFDLVTGASILHHLDRPQAGIDAAARALKPGGHAIFTEPFLGWSIIRLAYERILAEAELRNEPLDAAAAAQMRAVVQDITCRTTPRRPLAEITRLDDKWLFSRAHIEAWARDAGFTRVRFVPHNDHPTLYRDAGINMLRMGLGYEPPLPAWAIDILDSFDAAIPLQGKRELMLEGTIVLTNG